MAKKKSLSREHKINTMTLASCTQAESSHCLKSVQMFVPQLNQVLQILPASSVSSSSTWKPPLSPVTRREGNAESQTSPGINQAADHKQTISKYLCKH